MDAAVTARMWRLWQEGKKIRRWPNVVLTPAGAVYEVVPKGDDRDLVALAVECRGCVYNMTRRRCWRPVWWVPLELRTNGNRGYEPVELLRWEGIIQGWETRPRALLFTNDR